MTYIWLTFAVVASRAVEDECEVNVKEVPLREMATFRTCHVSWKEAKASCYLADS